MPDNRCPVTGYLIVDGRRVAAVRCDLEAGHDGTRFVCPCGCAIPLTEPQYGTPHRHAFEWEDDEQRLADLPGLYDPAEVPDVEVPELSDDEVAAIMLDAMVDRRVDGLREDRGE